MPGQPVRLSPYFFFLYLARMTCRSSQCVFLKKYRWCIVWFGQILTTMVARKSRLKVFYSKSCFQPIFDLKHLQKHLKNCDKSIYDLKKWKIYHKTKINLKQKIYPSSNIFFMNFQGNKTPNMNSPHQIK